MQNLPARPSKRPTNLGTCYAWIHHNLMGIGGFCDADCKVLFKKTSVTIFENKGETVIKGWRDNNGPELWNIYLLPNDNDSCGRNQAEQTTIGVYIAYDLPSVAALLRYFHEDVGYPVRYTCLNAPRVGNCAY